jgi:hypothetical protein
MDISGFAQQQPAARGGPIDWPGLKARILAGLDVFAEYEALGVRFERPHPTAKGWRPCRAVGRPAGNPDDEPSAAVHRDTGVYVDRGGGGAVMGFFDFALAHGDFGRWIDCIKHYAAKARVEVGTVPTHGKGRVREAVFHYREPDGTVRYGVFRYVLPSGKKSFSQHPADGRGGWKYGDGCMDGVGPLPYRLPELLATEPSHPAFVVEGEQVAERLAAVGLVATTSHGGAHNAAKCWPNFDPSWFAGRDLILLPDNDPDGRTYADAAGAWLAPIARSVKLLELPGLPPKGDAVDWLDQGHTVQELLHLGFDAPAWEPRPAPHPGSNGAKFVGYATGCDSGEDDWEPPVESGKEGVEAFPLDVFPGPLRDLCSVASTAMQCPDDFFAALALGLAGGVVGRSVNLTMTSTWDVAPNLYVVIVGAPGSKKSPALKLMARPLWDVDRGLREEHRAARRAYQRDKAAGVSGVEPPVARHLTMDDSTRESFAAALHDNPRGLVLTKDELIGWVLSLNAYRRGLGDDKQFWMSLNSGSPVKVTRKGNDREVFFIPRPCAAVVGCLTPAGLPTVRQGGSDDGWLDRILFAYPDPPSGVRRWTAGEVPAELLVAWDRAVNVLWGLPMVQGGEGPLPSFVRLTPEATALFAEWFNAHQVEQQDDEFSPSLAGPWSKMEGFCARFALILAMLAWAYDPERPPLPGDVGPLEMLGARRLAGYFKGHFRRALGELEGRHHDLPHDARLILRWALRRRETDPEHPEVFSARDISRNFARFVNLDRDRALAALVTRRYIRPIEYLRPEGKRGPTPSPTFALNPFLWNSHPLA